MRYLFVGSGSSIERDGGRVEVVAGGAVEIDPAAGKNTTIESGQLLWQDGDAAAPGAAFADATNTGLARIGSGVNVVVASTPALGVYNTRVTARAGTSIGWSSGNPSAGADLEMHREDPDTLAQYRGTNPQSEAIYNTRTDASNYERARLVWDGNQYRLYIEAAGTGTVRAYGIYLGGLNKGLWTTDGLEVAGRIKQSNYTDLAEIATPASAPSNTARLYAKDNGAGKTQLAVIFPTGAEQILATEP